MKQKIENRVFEIESIQPKDLNGDWIGTLEQTNANKTAIEFRETATVSNPFLEQYRIYLWTRMRHWTNTSGI